MLIGLVRGCHPGPTLAVTVVAMLLTVAAGGGAAQVLMVAVTVLAGQLSIGWSNDWLDAERDASRSDKPTASGAVSVPQLRTAAFASLGVSAVLSLVSWPAGLWQLLLVASGWVYNLGVKSTLWSPVPYAVGFGALPTYAGVMAGADVRWWLSGCGAALGVAAHFANVAPDVELDRSHGVRGLPQRIGARASVVVALGLLATAGTLLLTQVTSTTSVIAIVTAVAVLLPVAVGLVVLAGRAHSSRWTFRLVMLTALVDVGLLVAVTRSAQ